MEYSNLEHGASGRLWCKLVRDFLSNPNSAINNKNILTKSDVTLGGKPNIKFLKIDSDLKISISGVADKQEINVRLDPNMKYLIIIISL